MTSRRLSLVSAAFAALFAACSSDSATPVAPAEKLVIYGSAEAAPAAAVARTAANLHEAFDGPSAAIDSAAPAKLDIAMYALYLSKNENCTQPILVKSYGASGQVKDFVAHPVLFEAEPEAGTYPCMIFRMSDVLSMVPSRSFGGCDAHTTYVGDIYRDGETDWIDQDGNPIIGHGTDDAAGAVDDHVAIFFTVNPTAVLARGVSEHQLVPLTNALVSPGHSTLYWNMSGAVQSDGVYCGIEPRPITFR